MFENLVSLVQEFLWIYFLNTKIECIKTVFKVSWLCEPGLDSEAVPLELESRRSFTVINFTFRNNAATSNCHNGMSWWVYHLLLWNHFEVCHQYFHFYQALSLLFWLSRSLDQWIFIKASPLIMNKAWQIHHESEGRLHNYLKKITWQPNYVFESGFPL